MLLEVDDRVHLTEIRAEDAEALLVLLNDVSIHENTLAIPFPYRRSDADAFLATAIARAEFEGRPLDFAVRDGDEALLGAVGLHTIEPKHRLELGYWLGRPSWGRGIMTAAVRRVCEHAFRDLDVVRVAAHVFTYNDASCRVLEKVGFEREGRLRKQYRKGTRFVDAYAYGLLREE